MNKKIVCFFLGFALYATLANAAYIYQQQPSQYPVEGQSVSGQEQRYVALPLVQKSSQMSPEQQAQLLEQQRLQREKLRQTGSKQTVKQQEMRVHEEFPEQEFDSELKKQQEQEQQPEKPKEEKPQEKPKEEKEEKPKEGKKEKPETKKKEKEEKPEKKKKEKEEKEEEKPEKKKKEKEEEEKKKEPFKVLYKSDKFNLEKESPESSLKSNLDSQTLTINKKPSKQADESLQKMNEFIQLMQNFGLMSVSPQMDPITYEQLQQDMQPEMLIFKMQDDADESMDESLFV